MTGGCITIVATRLEERVFGVSECSKEYKEWLKKSLAGTIEPGPNVPPIIADVGAKHQVRLHRL